MEISMEISMEITRGNKKMKNPNQGKKGSYAEFPIMLQYRKIKN